MDYRTSWNWQKQHKNNHHTPTPEVVQSPTPSQPAESARRSRSRSERIADDSSTQTVLHKSQAQVDKTPPIEEPPLDAEYWMTKAQELAREKQVLVLCGNLQQELCCRVPNRMRPLLMASQFYMLKQQLEYSWNCRLELPLQCTQECCVSGVGWQWIIFCRSLISLLATGILMHLGWIRAAAHVRLAH